MITVDGCWYVVTTLLGLANFGCTRTPWRNGRVQSRLHASPRCSTARPETLLLGHSVAGHLIIPKYLRWKVPRNSSAFNSMKSVFNLSKFLGFAGKCEKELTIHKAGGPKSNTIKLRDWGLAHDYRWLYGNYFPHTQGILICPFCFLPYSFLFLTYYFCLFLIYYFKSTIFGRNFLFLFLVDFYRPRNYSQLGSCTRLHLPRAAALVARLQPWPPCPIRQRQRRECLGERRRSGGWCWELELRRAMVSDDGEWWWLRVIMVMYVMWLQY